MAWRTARGSMAVDGTRMGGFCLKRGFPFQSASFRNETVTERHAIDATHHIIHARPPAVVRFLSMPELLSVRLRDDGVGDYRSAKLFNTFRSGTISLFCPHHKRFHRQRGRLGLQARGVARRNGRRPAHPHARGAPSHDEDTRHDARDSGAADPDDAHRTSPIKP